MVLRSLAAKKTRSGRPPTTQPTSTRRLTGPTRDRPTIATDDEFEEAPQSPPKAGRALPRTPPGDNNQALDSDSATDRSLDLQPSKPRTPPQQTSILDTFTPIQPTTMATQIETETHVKDETDVFDAPSDIPPVPPAPRKGKERQEESEGFPDPELQASQAPDYRPSGSGGYVPYGYGASTAPYRLPTETPTPYGQNTTYGAPQLTSYNRRHVQNFGLPNLEEAVRREKERQAQEYAQKHQTERERSTFAEAETWGILQSLQSRFEDNFGTSSTQDGMDEAIRNWLGQ